MTQEREDGPSLDQPLAEPGLQPAEAVTPGNPYLLSKRLLLLFRITAAILVLSMSALLLSGFFHL